MRIIQDNIRCFRDGTDGRPACFANANGMCVILIEEISGRPCPFYKSKMRFFKELAALQEGNKAAYRSARFYDMVKEER